MAFLADRACIDFTLVTVHHMLTNMLRFGESQKLDFMQYWVWFMKKNYFVKNN